MTKKALTTAANDATGGLAQTSKMPCKSWSIPVYTCQTGSRMAKIEGTICSTCYAAKGNYVRFQSRIIPSQERRLAAYNDNPDAWCDGMVTLIGHAPHFRWFDSGDLQSPTMLIHIASVARRTPNTEHWLPTREVAYIKEAVHTAGFLPMPDNLTIRISATYPDKPMTEDDMPVSLSADNPFGYDLSRIALSNVHDKLEPVGYRCPAPTQDGMCGPCRACWSPEVRVVSYKQH